MLAILFGLLFVYWMLRVTLCKKSFLQMGLGILSLILFLVLPKEFVLIPTLVLIIILTVSLIKNMRKKDHTIDISKYMGWGSLYAVGLVVALLSLTFRSQESQLIGRVILKGNEQATWLSWQNPAQDKLVSAWMPSYQVMVQDAKGKVLFDDYLSGDYVGIRAQLVIIHWPFHLLGFSHLARLEVVHNGYSTAERHQFFPHIAKQLPYSSKLIDHLWKKLFMGEWQLPGVKSTTLESTFLPLRSAKLQARTDVYDLVVGSTGLSALLHDKDGLLSPDAPALCKQ
jgi:hypothetical protein